MGWLNNPWKATRAFISNPARVICNDLGVNHKKQVIRDAAQDQRAHEMMHIRNNNKYVKKAKEYGVFGDLEEAIDYKEWLSLNGPSNINSPYYSCHEISNKQDTSIVGINGHPNEYIGWEDRFNYDAYNRDLANAQAAINICKQQVQNESQQCRANINTYIHQQKVDENELINAKKIYNYAQHEYNLLIQKNQQLTQTINEQQLLMQNKRSDVSFKTSQLAELCIKVNKAHNTNININNTDGVVEKLIEKQQELTSRYHNLSSDERTKLFFKIFGTEKENKLAPIILNEGINLDLLAYMAVQFNQQIILEYALAKGASLDEYFVEGKTTIEHMIDSDIEKYSKILLNYNKGMFCTIINAAENNRIDILREIYKLDNNIFVTNDNSTGHTILHLMVLNDHFDALEYMLSTSPDAINVKSLAGGTLLKTSLKSASQEMSVFLMSRINNLENEIKEMIAEDEFDLVVKAMSIYEFDAQVRISIINFALQYGKFDLVEELLTDAQEIKQIFKEILTNNDFILAGKFYQIYQNNEFSGELDEVLQSKALPQETISGFENFIADINIEISSAEYADLMGIAENMVAYEYE